MYRKFDYCICVNSWHTEGHLNDVVSFLSQQTFINNVTEECLANCETMRNQIPIEDVYAVVMLSEEQIYRYILYY